MHTASALIDIHERTHRGLSGLLGHCAGFGPEELGRRLEGFGYPTLLLQLAHVIGAERYWIGVLNGEILVDEDPEDSVGIDALRAFGDGVAARTREYLRVATDEELNTPRRMRTWRGDEPLLVPAHVILRTQTHIFQHQGQVAAMCRLLGRPLPSGLDFPLT